MTHQNRPVIMVVDDDVTIRLLIQDILDDVFYKVMVVADGAAALAAMETVVPDLVTLDLDMPGLSALIRWATARLSRREARLCRRAQPALQ